LADIFVEVLIEYDGNGQPTGKATVNGSLYTGVSASEAGGIPRIDGKASTKVWVQHSAIVQDTLANPPTLLVERTTGKRKAIGWTKT